MSTINERWNIVDTTRVFCQKVLPLVYDESLSYMEQVCKVSSKLNEVIENNNNLPQYVKDLIKETVNSDDFTQIVGSVLMDTIINVKFPPEGIKPAKGDGVTDDTASIQSCLDYANRQGGAVVFFPSGKYLTGTLNINTETSILGADRYNTSLVLKGGGNTPLLQGAINQSVRNISLDGNRLNQVEENYLIDGTIDMALFDNVILCDSAHCITAYACNNSEFCNVLCKDIGDGVFITAAGNNNLLTNINTEYAINLTGDNNNWQSQQQTKIASAGPLVYGPTKNLNKMFNYVDAVDYKGNPYKILVDNGVFSGFSIYPEDFGAVGDGLTDDTNAIKAALDFCNSNLMPLSFRRTSYKIHAENLQIKQSPFFNGCTFIVDSDISDDGNYCFLVSADSENLTVTESTINKNGVTNSNLYNKSFTIVSPLKLGTRSIGEVIFYKQQVATNKNGQFVQNEYPVNIISGSYQVENIQELNDFVVLENFSVKHTGSKLTPFLKCTRSNLTIENVYIQGEQINQQNYQGSLFEFKSISNVYLKNIGGTAFISDTSGYVFGFFEVSNLVCENIVFEENLSTSWGSFGCSFINNCIYNNVTAGRIEVHYGSVGNYIIDNCQVEQLRFSYNFGTIAVRNTIIKNKNNLFSPIDLRIDYAMKVCGNIYFENLTFKNMGTNNFLFRSSHGSTVPENITLLNLPKLNLSMKNISIDSTIRGVFEINDVDVTEYNILIENCDFLLVNGDIFKTISNQGTLTVENCKIGSVATQTLVDNVIIKNCECPNGRLIVSNGNKTIIMDNVLIKTPVRPYECDFLMIVNSRIGLDAPFSSNATRQLVNNNVLITDTQNHVASWNISPIG